jgi:hypothetical protein
MDEREKMLRVARAVGWPENQMRNILVARIHLQQRQLNNLAFRRLPFVTVQRRQPHLGPSANWNDAQTCCCI